MQKETSRSPDLDKISPYQSFAILFSTMLGVGVLSFQREIAKEVGPDGIWTILVGGVLILAEVWLLTRVMEKYPHKNLAQFGEVFFKNRPRPWLGKLVFLPFALLVALFFFAASAVVTRTFGEVLISTVLFRTPLEVLMLGLLGVGAAVAGNRPQVIARFNEFVFPILLLPLPLYLVSFLQEGNLDNLFPLFHLNWVKLLKGVAASTFAYAGFSVIVVYMGYYQQPKKAVKPHLWAIGSVTFLYWIQMVVAVGVFGRAELVQLLWPTLDLLKVAAVPGMILERLESGFLAIWMVAVFTTIINLFGALVDMVVTFFGMREQHRKWVALGLLPVLYYVSYWPANLNTLFWWNKWIGRSEPLMGLVLILTFLLFAMTKRGKKGGKQDVPSA
ncbi:spore germination protein [Melghirimyces profundicolus]|uniref:Spore germination protein n=1 Tax=Melghirimyces profundicolus TaxID=1242148 RepID=A0A2T6BYT0_9BACL|nr:GerAB/ArcD/ProY family transporter [Melghirimyces profundicolus]PTX61223.1 spore germination protein [Melghirimyces profundicolus]